MQVYGHQNRRNTVYRILTFGSGEGSEDYISVTFLQLSIVLYVFISSVRQKSLPPDIQLQDRIAVISISPFCPIHCWIYSCLNRRWDLLSSLIFPSRFLFSHSKIKDSNSSPLAFHTQSRFFFIVKVVSLFQNFPNRYFIISNLTVVSSHSIHLHSNKWKVPKHYIL